MTERTTHILERMIPAPIDRVWELWTTAAGIEQWWAPEGFRADVEELDLREGGELIYGLTAVAPEQIAFMEQYGLPLSTRSRKTFTEIDAPSRIAYESLADFIPDREPYRQLTVVDLVGVDGGTAVRMSMEPMHDEIWTERLIAGRSNELDNLVKLVASSTAN